MKAFDNHQSLPAVGRIFRPRQIATSSSLKSYATILLMQKSICKLH